MSAPTRKPPHVTIMWLLQQHAQAACDNEVQQWGRNQQMIGLMFILTRSIFPKDALSGILTDVTTTMSAHFARVGKSHRDVDLHVAYKDLVESLGDQLKKAEKERVDLQTMKEGPDCAYCKHTILAGDCVNIACITKQPCDRCKQIMGSDAPLTYDPDQGQIWCTVCTSTED